MKPYIPLGLIAVGAGVVLLTASPRQAPTPPPASSVPASGQLPPDHPPLTDDAVAATPLETGQGATALLWTAPPDWVERPPASSMRRAQYEIPGDAGPAQLVVYYFGPGQGGDAQMNAERWANEFTPPGGGDPMDAAVIEELDVDGIAVLTIEMRGTYSGGMTTSGPAAGSTSDYMLLGAVAEGPDANWFFKLTGPESTVDAQSAAFDALIGSLERGR